MSLTVNVVGARQLTPALLGTWRELQRSNPALCSPYFCPEFTQSVATVRHDVEIAVLEEGRRVVGFFPYQRGPRGVGAPVGGIFSDYQGLICAPGFTCDPLELIRACRLRSWDFDHLLACQDVFAPFHLYQDCSPLVNLSNGFEAYAAGCHAVKAEQRKLRRIEKEVGPLRFVSQATDPASLATVLVWKSRQYVAAGKHDLFALAWTRPLIECLHGIQDEDFGGILSLLFAGERLVAGHFGMRSRTVWHYWFPSYDVQMAHYSPGLILLLKMAEYAASLGLSVIDLGKGTSLYKQRLTNASVLLAAGSVELPTWRSFRRSAQRRLRAIVVNSPMGGPTRQAIHTLRQQHASASPKK